MILDNSKISLLGKVVAVVYIAAFLLLILILLGQALAPKNNVVYYFSDLKAITEAEYAVNGVDQGHLQLPATLRDLNPGDNVTLTTTIPARQLDNLLIKTDNVHLRLYVNDAVYFTVGDIGTYPRFQHEPPVSLNSVALPRSPEFLDLRFEYKLSDIANNLELPVVYEGDLGLINSYVQERNFLPFAIAVALLVFGIALAVVGLTFYRRAELAISLFWLGLTCVACGSWTLCTNDLTLYLFPQRSMLYDFGYVGLLAIPLPFLRFGITMLAPRRPLVLETLFWVFGAAFVAILALHLGDVICFAESIPVLYKITPFIMALYLGILLFERHMNRLPIAPLFIFSTSLLVVLSALDQVNETLHILPGTGLLFQLGLLLDTAVIAVLVWQSLTDALDAAEKSAMLEAEVAASNRNLDLQRSFYANFAKSATEMRELRHDVRHQLSAVRGMITESKGEEAIEYIDKLYGNIPTIADKILCDNIAINALALHYMAKAEAANIQCDLRIDVPVALGCIPDNDLSVIIGNLFENAIEACMHVGEQKRFIKIRSNVAKSRFTFTVDNSYDGILTVSDQDFYSRKRNGKGIGVASVRAIVIKYAGAMKYEAADGVFKTSLYIKIKE
ncbi:hypothetical protein FACS1894185_0980 [Betaproteobacteria bacterium]|nr:hypothetical protein FACS1894185_0980 [Betaproteobacteria bacterium]